MLLMSPLKLWGKLAEKKENYIFPTPKLSNSPASLSKATTLFSKPTEQQKHFSLFIQKVPVLHQSGFTTRQKKVLVDEFLKTIDDPIPQEILNRYHLPSLQSALVWMHAPQNSNHAKSARKRFAFEEIFYIQLERWRDKNERIHKNAFRIDIEKKELQTFIDRFPFKATKAQLKAIDSIIKDLKSEIGR